MITLEEYMTHINIEIKLGAREGNRDINKPSAVERMIWEKSAEVTKLKLNNDSLKHRKVELRKMTDSELLCEFKRRFVDSVLYDLNIETLIDEIGMDKLKGYLKEQNLRIVKR